MNLILQAIKSLFRKLENNIAKTGESITKLSTRLYSVQKSATKALFTANSAKATANGKMSSQDPVGTGSFSMNRKAGSSVGTYSHAEGNGTTASGTNSHAEGYSTTASNSNSHAEGNGTKASGINSHAEGYNTTASGGYSHAEGYYTTASSSNSHAEGSSTTAFGHSSHAEGNGTNASGNNSHAEGLGTTAQRKSQHTHGEYNILDTAGSTSTRGTYVHIVGNGTSGTKRSNAHTLDWNGLGWFAGGLKVGGTGQDSEAAKNVLLEGDAIPVPETASVGQTLTVKSVDENGKPTEWGVVDAPTGGGNIDDEYINSLIDAKLGIISALVDEINGEVI